MRRRADSLAGRLTAILLGALVAIVMLAGVLLLLPATRGTGGPFDLPIPREARAIALALEGASDDAERERILEVINTSVITARVLDDFPPSGPTGPGRARERLEHVLEKYATALKGREFRIDVRRRFWVSYLAPNMGGGAPVRLSVRLRTGKVLVIERTPSRVVRTFIFAVLVTIGAMILVLLSVLGLALRQTTLPVSRLAEAVRRFTSDLDAPDLTPAGPREVRDLSADFNELKQRIRELVAGRTRVLAAIAHDLRTYLTRLRLWVDYLDDEEKRASAIADIEEMSALIDDTLMFARQDSTRAVAERFDVAAELDALVEARQACGDPVTWSRPAADLPVQGSRLALRRMISNLFDNAIRYGGCARLTAGGSDLHVWIEVADDGPGAPEADLERIIEPFERLEPSRARHSGGAGLGLAIVQGLAQAHGGRLILRNLETPGRSGLVARIELPRAA